MYADAISYDAEDRPLLAVKSQGGVVGPDMASQLLAYLKSEGPPLPYSMVVDPEKIYIVRHDSERPEGFDLVLDTADVLRFYDPEISNRSVDAGYLSGLIGVWLNDMSFHWKSASPPKSDELAAIGLLPRLDGGITRREVNLVF